MFVLLGGTGCACGDWAACGLGGGGGGLGSALTDDGAGEGLAIFGGSGGSGGGIDRDLGELIS